MIKALSGNGAVAEAIRQINPHVVAAYPITPQSEAMENFAKYVANGEADTEMVLVESEHSALSSCVGASAAGARAMTATSSQGLALMNEVTYVASGMRLPIVMNVANRALSLPVNIHPDHSDSMSVRDSGWIQLYAENAQEVYDNTIQGVRIAENENVLLPIMSIYEGFIVSHMVEGVDVLADSTVSDFIGKYIDNESLLDVKNPKTMGYATLPSSYFEIKRKQIKAIERSREVINKVGREYREISGREYSTFERYKLKNAEIAIICLGSSAGTVKKVVDDWRRRGKKVGLIKIRSFRPFPGSRFCESLSEINALAVLDRSTSPGANGGPVFNEIKGILFDEKLIHNYIYGLGGRDLTEKHVKKVFRDLYQSREGEDIPTVNYLG